MVSISSGLLISAAVGRLVAQRRLDRRVRSAPGLNGPVRIERSSLGVPHIIAGSREDALFGLGYAMAADRLWQMDLIRRKATGRLAEIAGEAELDSDRLMRLSGIAEASLRSVEHCTSDACSCLDAVASGINHFIEHHPTPKEFLLAGYRPDLWTPADSVACFLMMGWSLGGSMFRADLFAERSRVVIGDEWTDAMFEGRSAEAPPSVREQAAHFGSPAERSSPAVFPDSGFSNSWAVGPDRSWTGSPLLAFDPHLEYTNPSVWYEAMLEAPDFHVAGMTLPGLPGIGSGRNLHIAWGETAGMVSQSFVYREDVDEETQRVRDGDAWVDLDVDEHLIRVKGRAPEVFTVRKTPRGPLISDLLPELCDGPVSLHWTGAEVSTEPDLLLGLNMATSVDDAIRARKAATVPVYNASIADDQGNIAQVVVGKIPIREPRAGLLDPVDFPPRYVPVDEMPVEVNPARGWVAGANARLVDDDYPYPMYGVWEPPFRMRRIADVLESREKHSMADMRALQIDRFSLHAAELTPIVIDLLGDGYPETWVLEDLRDWDFITGPESRPTALFQAFYTNWMRVSLLHRYPAEYVTSGLLASGAASVPRDFCDRLLKGELKDWFGDASVRRTLVRVAMDDALRWLRETLGDDVEGWAWGDINQVSFHHPLGVVAGAGRVVSPGPFPLGGDRTTVWPTAWRTDEGYEVAGGPSMRVVMDLRRPELTWGTNTLGQNGSPWKRHYRDQVGDFLAGRMHRVWQVDPPASVMVIRPE